MLKLLSNRRQRKEKCSKPFRQSAPFQVEIVSLREEEYGIGRLELQKKEGKQPERVI